jgi:exopolysaccharide biosynthesis polyprenyl glycosylphosphotransferase
MRKSYAMNGPPVRRRPALIVRHRPVLQPSRHIPLPATGPDDDVVRIPDLHPAAPSRTAHRAAVLAGCDVVAMLASGALTVGPLGSHLVAGASTMLCLARLDLYRFRRTVSLLDDLPWLALAAAVGVLIGALASRDLSTTGLTVVLYHALVAAVSLATARAAIYALERRCRRQGGGEATLILGTGQIGRRLGRAMLDHPEYGLRLVGYLDDDRRRRESPPAPLLGRTGELGWWIERLGVGSVVVTFGSTRVASLVEIVRTCDRLRCEVLIVPRLFELHSSTRDTEYVHGLPVVRLRRAPFRRITWRVKRAIDVLCSTVAIVALAPLFIVCAIAVRLDGGKGVLFRQERVSVDGRRFQMYKFRTMTPGTSAEAQQRWSIAGDARIRPIGRILRSTSLDELPQLVNVLRGDMSLVGPRPERPYFVEQLSQHHPRYGARHRVPVGLTGWAAVHGLRGDTSISDRVEFDNAYIQNWSLWLDAKIMLRTLGAVLGRTGA